MKRPRHATEVLCIVCKDHCGWWYHPTTASWDYPGDDGGPDCEDFQTIDGELCCSETCRVIYDVRKWLDDIYCDSPARFPDESYPVLEMVI